jgi:Flp pilus assembly protein protease CpaA
LDALFLCVLSRAAWTDIKKREISNTMAASVFGLGVAMTVLAVSQNESIMDHILGLIIVIPLIVLGCIGRMGGGDYKFLLGTGLYLGLTQSLIAIIMIAPATLCLAIYYLIKYKTIRTKIPLAPLIGLGCMGCVALKWILQIT